MTQAREHVRAAQVAAVAAWMHPAGSQVIVRRDDGSELVTTTQSSPWLLGGRAVILVDGISGAYALDRVRLVVGADPSAQLTAEGLGEGRIAEALALIEEAQHTLERAAQALCPIIGAIPEWRKTMLLGNRVHEHWYAVKKKAEKLRASHDGLRVDDGHLRWAQDHAKIPELSKQNREACEELKAFRASVPRMVAEVTAPKMVKS